jgi:TnpA family transposase
VKSKKKMRLMRHPGRCLAQGEQVPAAMVTFIANQLSVEATAFVDYARRDNTRREHAAELQRYLDLRLSTRGDKRIA